MRVVVFGATGMVGQGVVQECLRTPHVTAVITVGRTPTGIEHSKLTDLVVPDLFDLAPVAKQLSGLDGCVWCLGTPSAGKDEASYRRITYDLTHTSAVFLLAHNPGLKFVYVSGQGADSSEKGSFMWARVRGQIENALRALPFAAVHVLRPGMIVPLDGIRSKTRLYAVLYSLCGPLLPLLRWLMPNTVVTTTSLAQAALGLLRGHEETFILAPKDFARVAGH